MECLPIVSSLKCLDLGPSLHGLLSPLRRYYAPALTNVKGAFEDHSSTHPLCSDGLYQPYISFAFHVPKLHPVHIPLGAFYVPFGWTDACNICGVFIKTIFTHPTEIATAIHMFPYVVHIETFHRRFVPQLSVPLHGNFYRPPTYHKPCLLLYAFLTGGL